MDVLEFAKGVVPEMTLAMMTARDDGSMLEAAIKAGAFDVLVKPFTMAQADALVLRVGNWRRLCRENAYLRENLDFCSSSASDELERIYGNSYQMTRALQLCHRASSSDKTVLMCDTPGGAIAATRALSPDWFSIERVKRR